MSDAHDRLRRQEEEEEDLRAIVNEEGVIEFYIGFRMDNVEATRNISKLLPLKKKFMVFQDPKIGLFDPNPQLFYPHDQTNTDMPVSLSQIPICPEVYYIFHFSKNLKPKFT